MFPVPETELTNRHRKQQDDECPQRAPKKCRPTQDRNRPGNTGLIIGGRRFGNLPDSRGVDAHARRQSHRGGDGIV